MNPWKQEEYCLRLIHNSCTPSKNSSFHTFDQQQAIHTSSHSSKSNEAPNNPYLDDNLIHKLHPFTAEQNKSFEDLYRVNDTNNMNMNNSQSIPNIQWNHPFEAETETMNTLQNNINQNNNEK
eukprot:TRINITY_DN9524_c0_g1_i1.p1 TRINITY_DN9524_c0_g1~~TRINITY_DN9524_c0_g1_i1.p1  ORF type:complete len:123 (+),score=35.17 TRINITY_DN9524_c0_g1_i1:338-706(+)